MSRKKSSKKGTSTGSGSNGDEVNDQIQYISLSQETRRRYLNYALSVITSRALPDVRDGLKPVQRRILYAMYHDLHLTADAKTRKAMKICGDTTGNYHPHGEVAVYETLVRLAQDFTLRYPLVHGQGNFGSVIGLPPAAARYTEAKLTPIAERLLEELRFETVDSRPNYDATRDEPIVLPAQFPSLLANGTQGIAVGMATNIPPHNLGELINACVMLIENSDVTVAQLMKAVKGPDFPLGGRVVADRTTLRLAYEEGRGSIKVRAEWKPDRNYKGVIPNRFVIHSVPYAVETGPLVASIGEIVATRKIPQLLDVNDESDSKSGLRIVLELKPGSDPNAVMAYLFKHTSLEQSFAYNTTCLIPDEHGHPVPRRLSLKELLQQFLDFRFITVRKRFEYQLRQLEKRIHILEGFEIVFDGLEKALKIIRASSGKPDAAEKLMAAFPLDAEQTNAILELQLYRISQLEIGRIREELAEKRAEAERIRKILGSDRQLWKVVQNELTAFGEKFGDPRRTAIGSADEVAEFDPQAYIVRENTNVVLTREGWLKRVGRIQKLESTRVREGDSVLDVLPGSTLDHVVLFSSDGIAYTLPIDQIPVSSGYGEPLSKHVKMADGALIVRGLTTDPRFTPAELPAEGDGIPGPYLLVITSQGQGMRIPLGPFRTASTKSGRKFCRLREGDRVAHVSLITDATTFFIATRKARVIHVAVDDIPVLSGAGKGARAMKVAADDEVLGAVHLHRPSDCLRIRNTNGKEMVFGQMKYEVTSRGGKGIRTSHRSDFAEILMPPIEIVDWSKFEGDA